MPRSKQLNAQMRAESQAQILNAARRLFAEEGYFSCKVTDIAKAAGMSTGNVYWYFESKEEILKAVLNAGFEAEAAVLAHATAFPGTEREKLRYLVEQYVILCQEQADFVTIFASLLGHGGYSFFAELGIDTTELGARYHETLRSIVTQAQGERTIPDVEPEILVMSFFAFFNGLMITYGETWLTQDTGPFEDAVMRLLGGETSEEGMT